MCSIPGMPSKRKAAAEAQVEQWEKEVRQSQAAVADNTPQSAQSVAAAQPAPGVAVRMAGNARGYSGEGTKSVRYNSNDGGSSVDAATERKRRRVASEGLGL